MALSTSPHRVTFRNTGPKREVSLSDDLVTAWHEATLATTAAGIHKKLRNHRWEDEKTTLEDKNQTRDDADEQDRQPEPPLAQA